VKQADPEAGESGWSVPHAPRYSPSNPSRSRLVPARPFDGRQYVFAERGAHGSALPTNSANFDLGRCVIGERYKLIYTALWQIPYTPVDFAGHPFWAELQSR
jgi:hypothetical protein